MWFFFKKVTFLNKDLIFLHKNVNFFHRSATFVLKDFTFLNTEPSFCIKRACYPKKEPLSLLNTINKVKQDINKKIITEPEDILNES